MTGTVISGTYNVAVTLTSPANNPPTVLSSGKVMLTTASIGALYGKSGAAWTIGNSGLINGGSVGNGLQLGSSGNYVGASLVTNLSGGIIEGQYGIRVYNSAGSSITNQTSASITAIQSTLGPDSAVYMYASGTVTNFGAITAPTSNSNSRGVLLSGGGVVIDNNTGTIAGGSGVLLDGVGTVTNAGTIESGSTTGIAVDFTDSGANRLVVGPGAVFVGDVAGGSGTLELASAASAGTLTAAGFTNFNAIDFDAGSQWTLAGSTTALAGIISGFTSNDTIDLLGFAATAASYAGGNLTLTNISNAHTTLHFSGGPFNTGIAHVATNASGTDITLATAAATYNWTGGSADWTTAADWSTTIAPGATAIGTISNAGSNLVAIGGSESISVAGVVLSAGNTLNVAGTLVVSGTLSVSTGVVSVTNTGVISGNAAGITLYGAGGSVTNLGKISGGVGIAVTGTAASGHTIINAGTIIGTGGTAVSFGTGTNRLIDDPGAEFTGDINGGNSASAVLELASAASRGTISDFNGATITNFATLQFDTGAAWTVSRTSAASGLGSIDITGFAANDTIDLIGFVVATDTFGSNVVTFANSGASQHATLHLAGTFSGSTLQFGTDGAGGTDIFLGNAPLLYGATLDETGIVAVSETVASGVMTLFNSGTTAVGTIVVGTSLSTGDFTLKAVGTTATDVIVSSVFGTYASGVTLLTNPTTITATAAVGNTANNVAAVNGPNGTAWTVTNFGTITETGGNSIGIELNAGGTAVNAGTISGSLAVGISVTGTGSVTNLSTGTISSLSVMTLAFGLPAPATSRTTARYWELKVSSATDRSPLRTLASS